MVGIKFPIGIIKNEKTIHTGFLIVGILLIVYILSSIRIADIADAFRILGFNMLVPCMLVVIGMVIRSIRLKLLLGKFGTVSFLNVFKAVFETALFVVYSPGKAGEVMKLDLFKKYGIRRTDSLAAIIVERVSDLVVVILFSLGILFTLNLNLYPVIILMAVGIISVAVLYRLNMFKEPMGRTIQSIKKFWDMKTMLVLCILTPALWLIDAFIPYFILEMLGYNVGFQTVATMYYASILVGLISMIPGGLGSLDFSFSYALSNLASVLRRDAIITIIISRIAAFVVCFAGAVLYFREFKGVYHGRQNIAKSEEFIK